jgi:hypothetical protein
MRGGRQKTRLPEIQVDGQAVRLISGKPTAAIDVENCSVHILIAYGRTY